MVNQEMPKKVEIKEAVVDERFKVANNPDF